MLEQQPNALREKVKQLATQALQNSDPSGWFEPLYADAKGDASLVPWARLTPHPYLQDWLDQHTPQGHNHSALVIGCGLGDDAEALQTLGFKVTGFDISPTAIAWCQKRFPNSFVTYVVADLLALDSAWYHGFDFVFECRTIQALPLNIRSQAIAAIARLVAQGGRLLVVTRFRETEAIPEGPPWPLSNSELAQFQELGLSEIRRDSFIEGDTVPVQQLRVEFMRLPGDVRE